MSTTAIGCTAGANGIGHGHVHPHVHGKKSDAFDVSLSALLGGDSAEDADVGVASAAPTSVKDDEDLGGPPKSKEKRAKDDASAAAIMAPPLVTPPLPVHVLSVSLPPVEVNEPPTRTTPSKTADMAKAPPVPGPEIAQPENADAAPLADAPAATPVGPNASPSPSPTPKAAPPVAAAMVPPPPSPPARSAKPAAVATRPAASATTAAASPAAVTTPQDTATPRAVTEIQAPAATRPEERNAERSANAVPSDAAQPREPRTTPVGRTSPRGHRAADGSAEPSTAKVGAPVLADPAPTAFAPPSPAIPTASVKNLTGVNATTVAEPGPRQAPETVANAVSAAEAVGHKRALADVAHGQIQVPELGRIEVSARAGGAHVDVRVRADAVHAQDVIAQNAPEMRAHLRVEVPNATVHVDRSSSGTDPSRSHRESTGTGRGGESLRERERGGRGEERSRREPEEPRAGRRGARVRFVL